MLLFPGSRSFRPYPFCPRKSNLLLFPGPHSFRSCPFCPRNSNLLLFPGPHSFRPYPFCPRKSKLFLFPGHSLFQHTNRLYPISNKTKIRSTFQKVFAISKAISSPTDIQNKVYPAIRFMKVLPFSILCYLMLLQGFCYYPLFTLLFSLPPALLLLLLLHLPLHCRPM